MPKTPINLTNVDEPTGPVVLVKVDIMSGQRYFWDLNQPVESLELCANILLRQAKQMRENAVHIAMSETKPIDQTAE